MPRPRQSDPATLAASGALSAPPRPPDPNRDRTTARGVFADSFMRVLGLDEMDAAESARRTSAAKIDRYSVDPVAWVRERAEGFLWSKQQEIIESVRDNRLTAVPSCHSGGKSFLAAHIAGWWLDAHPPGEAFVVTSASTESQVKAVLWREMSRVHTRARMSGRMTQAEWYMRMPSGKEELVAFGRKPADMDPTAFQGIHAKFVLVIFDEAGGIVSALWDPADSLISNTYSRFLAIGNPDDPESEFCKVCKPGSGWKVIPISAFDTPNFTSEPIPTDVRDLLVSPVWVEEKRKKWGETNPHYIARVLGRFPELSEGGLIPASWIRAAQEYDSEALAGAHPVPTDPIVLGVDVGGGNNKSVIALRRGVKVEIAHRSVNPDTMQTLGIVMQMIATTGATRVNIDNIGLGKAVADRAAEIARDQRESKITRARAASIVGTNVGQTANDSSAYINLRAEAYWKLRERFQATANKDYANGIDIDAKDEDLAAQLVDITFKPTSHGKTQIESKDEMKRRGKVSPDDADAVMLAFCDGIKKPRAGVWGRRYDAR